MKNKRKSKMPYEIKELRHRHEFNEAVIFNSESKIEYLRDKAAELSGTKKKKFLPFKEGMKILEEKKRIKKLEREMKINRALLKRRRK